VKVTGNSTHSTTTTTRRALVLARALGVAALAPTFVALSLASLILFSYEAVGQAGGGGAPPDRLENEKPN